MKKLSMFLLLLGIATICAKEKKAHLQGWYPTHPGQLKKMLNQLETLAGKNYTADLHGVKAIIVPHAGYRYSGSVAAAAFRQLKGTGIKRVILIAPSHAGSFEGMAVLDVDKYTLPTGSVQFDTKVIKQLLGKEIAILGATLKPRNPFYQEHSVEIELPLIQYYLPEAKVVPLLIGNSVSVKQARIIAKNLKSYIDNNTVVVISSDFTHYGPRFKYRPFKDFVRERITRLDDQVLQTIFRPSLQQFYKVLQTTKATVCGRLPIMILLALLEEKIITGVTPYLVAYATSADEDATIENSVSYVSVVFAQPQKPKATYFTQYEKNAMLKLTRAAIKNKFTKQYDQEKLYPIKTPALQRTNGAFITVYDPGKKLRGCIGSITTSKPLYETIYQRAQDAAFGDTRFAPLKKDELDKVTLKVSVLTDPVPVKSYQSIELGKHGIIIKKKRKSAVYLPEVAVEQKWDLPTTLSHLNAKAGLARDAWKKGAAFEVFESINFEEK